MPPRIPDIAIVRALVPHFSAELHKGQAGRIGIIGGSEDYTGAPYFSAVSSMRLTSVTFSANLELLRLLNLTRQASSKRLDLIVHPYMRTQKYGEATVGSVTDVVDRVSGVLSRLHVLVVGPGLSRDVLMQEAAKQIIKKAREEDMALVLDADALFMIQKYPETIKDYPKAILTPNVVEFKRLCDAMNVVVDENQRAEATRDLSKALGGVTIVQKGQVDYISNGTDLQESIHTENVVYKATTVIAPQPTLVRSSSLDPISNDHDNPRLSLSKAASAPPTSKPTKEPLPFSFKLSRQHQLQFKARMTKFDSSNPETSNDTFRGFYTLFWIATAFYVIQTVVRCYEQEGILLSLGFYRLMSKDSLALLAADLVMLKVELPKITATAKTEKEKADLQHKEAEIAFLEEELVHGKTRYPNNVTFANYVDYMLVPTLVYWMEYPRTDRIRPWYVVEKIMATLGTFFLLYVTTERYILPKLYDPNLSEARVVVELIFPFMTNYLFLFYIIYECILNAFAELTR
ncbi:hypothetical protein EC973_001458 [Apophysomyces ossiformis]|uniref:ATP-dependent (S)-NAD(P)H-hydrate dehydratase n=1 Tax=Apophysomyces ossiformis TaxID=679940 RepID=A0A8H7BM04_9FUNG|nr:hypothetical protein EC973_001458 [Apophysomyces ossiformis]